jgi:hypothetical protein
MKIVSSLQEFVCLAETISLLPVEVNNEASCGYQIKPFPLSSVVYPFFARCCLSAWFWHQKKYVNVRTMCSSLQKEKKLTVIPKFTTLPSWPHLETWARAGRCNSMPWMITERTCIYVTKLGRTKQLNQGQNSCVAKLEHETPELKILTKKYIGCGFHFMRQKCVGS